MPPSSHSRNREIVLNDVRIGRLQPVVANRPMTKAGRLSLRGEIDGRVVKIFECASAGQATFVHEFLNSGPLVEFLPESLFSSANLVICEWVAGKPVDSKILVASRYRLFLEQARAFLDCLHADPVRADTGFDYVDDFIKPRFERCCDALGLVELNRQLNDSLQRLYALSGERWFSHADLTPANVVLADNGHICIIDNELLGSSRLPFLDELNFLNGLRGRVTRDYRLEVKQVLKRALELVDSDHELDAFNVWMMRQLGGQYVAGRVDEILDFARLTDNERIERSKLWRFLRAA